MPSWGSKLIFPIHFLSGIASGGEARTDITEAISSEQRNQVWSKRRRNISFEGLTLLNWQMREFEAFQDYVMGMAETFLFMDPARCTMVSEEIGIGDGTETEFQLQISHTTQGRSPIVHRVLWPDHDYPDLYLRDGTVKAWPRAPADGYVHIFVNGGEIDRSNWNLARENAGVVTFNTPPANGAVITASGYFYTLVRFAQDHLPAERRSGGTFVITSGGVIEPKGAEG